MNRTTTILMILSGAVFSSGCQSPVPKSERGPDHTVAYYVTVESSVPGISIETNKVFAGKTPMTLRIFGDGSGCFHNFGSPEFVVSALPSNTNEFLQAKVFRTGLKSRPGDHIPGFIFFNMNLRTGGLLIDSFPDK